MEKKSFDLVLKWSGRTPTEAVMLAFEHVKKQIPIWEVCKLVTFEEYKQLIADGKIEDDANRTYWRIEEGQVGVVASAAYVTSYTMSWENMQHCYKDFIAGYEACEKKYTFLREWDEAIAFNKVWDDFMLNKKRSFFFSIDSYKVRYTDFTIDDSRFVKISHRRNGTARITISSKCTGPEFYDLICKLCYDYHIEMPTLPYDPTLELQRQYRETHQTGKVSKKTKRSYSDPAEACVEVY